MTELLERRRQIQAEFDKGVKPDFLAETAHVRFACSSRGPGWKKGGGLWLHLGSQSPASVPA